jgi:hypothetical protein
MQPSFIYFSKYLTSIRLKRVLKFLIAWPKKIGSVGWKFVYSIKVEFLCILLKPNHLR